MGYTRLAGSPSGLYDAFVAKLNATGSALLHGTYLGGAWYDLGLHVAWDAVGAVYVAGNAGSDFPTRSGAIQTMHGGATDAFVAKLVLGSPDGAGCTGDGECSSGFCTDGVCCESACSGGPDDCQACSVAAGAALDGTCAPTTGNACTDGLACTTIDTCVAGVCMATTSACDGSTICLESGGAFACGPCPAGTFSANGTGMTACIACEPGTWSVAGATSCAAWSDCEPGERVVSTDAMSDRACAACATGTFSATANATHCSPWTVCDTAEYESAAPTATADRVCTTLSVCAVTEYESMEPTTTSDRQCLALTPCEEGEFESSAPSPTRDRECSPCSACREGEVELGACEAAADTVCASIDGGLAMSDGGVEGGVDGGVDGGVADASIDGSAVEPRGGGCGCRTTGPNSTPANGLPLVFGWMAIRRRRSRLRT